MLNTMPIVSSVPIDRYAFTECLDADQIQQMYALNFRSHELRFDANSSALSFRRQHIPLENMSLNYLEVGVDMSVMAELEDSYLIQLPVRECIQVQCGREQFVSDNKRAVVCSAGQPFQWHFIKGCARWSVRIDRTTLQRRLSSLLGRTVTRPLVFQSEMRTDSGAGASWWRIVNLLTCELACHDSVVSMSAGLESFEQLLLTGLLEGQPSNYSDEIHTRSRSDVSLHVRYAEAFMRSNAQEDIGIDDIVAASGVSYRTLYDGFKKVHNSSPMSFLKGIRMEGARHDLLSAHSEEQIAAVAMRWCFFHLGRFSGEYKHRFGETPSQTRARSLRSH